VHRVLVEMSVNRPGMKPMERIAALTASKDKNYDFSAGITFSIEGRENEYQKIESLELDILKAILNREAYLGRLRSVSRTISRKFKPEVADMIDLVRAATLDVVEALVIWREAKGDHNAAYNWKGTNYLLKLSSDLDYLADYNAIKR
jgi:hypothetical protein